MVTMDADATIKSGDSNIVAAIREFWNNTIQDKIYAMSLSRNLPGNMRVIGLEEKLWSKKFCVSSIRK